MNPRTLGLALAGCLLLADTVSAAWAAAPVIVAGSGSNLAATHALADAFGAHPTVADAGIAMSDVALPGFQQVYAVLATIGYLPPPIP